MRMILICNATTIGKGTKREHESARAPAKSLILKGFLFKKNHIFLKKNSFIINGLAIKKA